MLASRRSQRTARTRRLGATVVECALVLSIFLMLLLGIFEYCRFLFTLHVTNNAAREGARYASVNMNCTSGTQMLPGFSGGGGQVASTQQTVINYTTMMMSNVQSNISGYTVTVYAVNPTGLSASPPTIAPSPTATSWNNTTFPNSIAVTITGTYVPALPSFLLMPSTVPINITALMVAE